MRVVAGTHGGRRLGTPPGDATRPTSDRVREALFSILGDRVRGRAVLDLFAGSGALGIEALSRGAAEAVFVDRAPAALTAVRANLESLGMRAAVHRSEALRFLRTASADGRHYGLILLDPPYRDAEKLGEPLAPLLAEVLTPDGLVVVETDRRTPMSLTLPQLDERRYGDTLVRIYGAQP